eukprot:161119-Amphidinium_carterae.1
MAIRSGEGNVPQACQHVALDAGSEPPRELRCPLDTGGHSTAVAETRVCEALFSKQSFRGVTGRKEVAPIDPQQQSCRKWKSSRHFAQSSSSITLISTCRAAELAPCGQPKLKEA